MYIVNVNGIKKKEQKAKTLFFYFELYFYPQACSSIKKSSNAFLVMSKCKK